jgi:predicted SAM-dependent methyltransferase
MKWSEVSTRKPLYLNFGGFADCDPQPNYTNYISVDILGGDGSRVQHDLSQPLPLPAQSVDRILSEHFLEHTSPTDMAFIFDEFYRLLKPGGHVRAAVPDYNHPRDVPFLKQGSDPRHTDHLTLTTYTKISEVVANSKFKKAHFYHYWDENLKFHYSPIDYSLGHIKRTPDNDPRCKMPKRFLKRLEIYASNFFFKLKKGSSFKEEDLLFRRGNKYAVTSLVFDLKKPL